ncbi:hypothetical protein AM1_3718 [Acaryochloris marina MBIC11017]|uniref:Uncharacterized protein n=1 Tax=Acaryochloris marina (strain MBIC 11017) TaxID=329726 RepID=B0C4G4_ACAM1|nr:hypothetical protein AM1_3718 [Acaryochloris marina MBIC11017]
MVFSFKHPPEHGQTTRLVCDSKGICNPINRNGRGLASLG